ncbi:MAG: adenine deaminase [Flavipsychrobacter sp.]
MSYKVSGQYVDLFNRIIFGAEVTVIDKKIASITPIDDAPDQYILPGFIDAHIHIESSMLVPTAFAAIAVKHGTVATISDPHEIANVCGIEGVQYMIDNSRKTPFQFFFGAPSCVPATSFETAGATIDAEGIKTLLQNPDIWYLAEMMNFPGVLYKDKEVMVKLDAAKVLGKPIDGHAPGLRGEQAHTYAAAGITTDHECFTLEEAMDKIDAGMKIIIREGSAAKNFEALHPLLLSHPEKVMFCSDDKHPDELVLGHINDVVKRSIAKGYDIFDVLNAACVTPVQHYKVPVGLLRTGDDADFIVVDNLTDLNTKRTYIKGALVAEEGKSLLEDVTVNPLNNFDCAYKNVEDFKINTEKKSTKINVIEALEGQLITNPLLMDGKVKEGQIISDTENDILKIVVVNRYQKNAPVAKAFIKNFNLKQGAIASTVAHDCHNIIAVGVDDDSICAAVNALIAAKGGISVATDTENVDTLPLPVAGLMTDVDGNTIAKQYSDIDQKAKKLGTQLHAPFMTLSFMALLVIPALKLSDIGLFDGSKFEFTSVEA